MRRNCNSAVKNAKRMSMSTSILLLRPRPAKLCGRQCLVSSTCGTMRQQTTTAPGERNKTDLRGERNKTGLWKGGCGGGDGTAAISPPLCPLRPPARPSIKMPHTSVSVARILSHNQSRAISLLIGTSSGLVKRKSPRSCWNTSYHGLRKPPLPLVAGRKLYCV